MDKSLPIVGVGASAGGLEALRQMLGGSGRGGMPDMAFVVIQHLDPTHESMMAQLVERYTSMRVHQIDGGEKVQGGCVYIIPPGHGLSIEDGVLHLTEFTDPRGMRRPIDDFFETLAEDAKGMAACVILSGTGADGSRGMRAIKEHGGICVVQEPTSARYDGMPLSAKGTGLVDFVTDPEDIIDCLATYFGRKTGDELEDDAAVVADHLDELCATLRNAVGHDFTQYKRATLMRRVARRMQVLGITDGDDYLKRLKNDAEECDALFRDLLINVTRFFRDADAFDVLRSEVIEPMVRNSSDRDELRVWVPGCSSGEEAFTLAMLFADAMESLDRRPIVNIFASDIDEQMLRQARAALYPIAHLPDIPTDLRNRYTLGRGDHFTLAPQIRDMVRFSSHSVIKDPPFSRIDLVSCRNLLIYFDDKLQQAVLPMFHYALAPGGALFLGPSETIGRHDDLFKPIDGPNRLFRRTDKAPKYPLDIQLGAPSKKPRRSVQRQDTASMPGRGVSDAVAVLTENYAPASLLVDREGSIISSWGPVGRYFAFPSSGEERQSASALAKPGLREVLGGFLRQMVEKSRRQTMRDVEVQTDFGAQSVQLFGEPVRDGTFLIVLRETGGFQPRDVDRFIEVDEVDDHVAQLEDDLRITRYRLRSTVEELETANEELKSSNEEMMSMNEELQSTNEELTTVNDELKNKVDELTAANADLTNFFDSTQLAVVVLDGNLRVRSFTDAATDLFPFRDGDRGRLLSEVVPQLEDDSYIALARKVADTGETVEERFRSSDLERDYMLRIVPYRMADGSLDGVTMVFTNITQSLALERRLKEKRERLDMALRIAEIGVWEYDADTGTVRADAVVRRFYNMTADEEVPAQKFIDLIYPADRDMVREALDNAVANDTDYDVSFRIGDADAEEEDMRWLRGMGHMQDRDGKPVMVGVNFETTHLQQQLHTRELLLREMNHRIKNLFAVVGGMIAIGAREAEAVDDFATDLRNRLAAMGKAHSLTQGPEGDDPVVFRELLTELMRSARHGQDVTLDGPDVEIPAKKVTPLTLILHEWLTNASKHGAFSFAEGELEVRWALEDGALTINWREKVPENKDDNAAGFGTRLIDATVRQLRATIDGGRTDGHFARKLVVPDMVMTEKEEGAR